MEITPFHLPNYVYFRLDSQKALKWLPIASYRSPAKIQFIAGHFPFTADQRMLNLFFSKRHIKCNRYTPSHTNNQSDSIAIQWPLTQTTSCKIVEIVSLKNTFSSFQYPPYLEYKPLPLPFPSPPFNIDCLSLQQFFCLASNTDKEGGRGAAVWEIIGKLITPQEGEVSLHYFCNLL